MSSSSGVHYNEVYYVASGRAKMMINSDGDSSTFDVGPGTIIFVPALVHHSFYDITERLALLVFQPLAFF